MESNILDTHAPGDVIEHNGRQAIVLANGSLIDAQTKRFMAGHAPVNSFTPDSAQIANYTRWHKPRQDAILRAVRDATGDAAGELYKDYGDADGYLTEVIVKEIILNNDERGQDRVKALEALDKRSGTSGEAPKHAREADTDADVLRRAGRATLLALAQRIEQSIGE